jgi:hypothetical protein
MNSISSGNKRELKPVRGLGKEIFLEGDSNTAYFHDVAKQRRRKKIV